jgi:hypothetical protein
MFKLIPLIPPYTHLRFCVEAMTSLDLAMSTDVVALKPLLVTDAEIFHTKNSTLLFVIQNNVLKSTFKVVCDPIAMRSVKKAKRLTTTAPYQPSEFDIDINLLSACPFNCRANKSEKNPWFLISLTFSNIGFNSPYNFPLFRQFVRRQ